MNQLRHLTIPLLASLLSSTLLAQAPDVLWMKTNGYAGHDYYTSVQQTTDGGFILAGTTGSFSSDSSFYWLVRLDSDGNIVWDKVFPADKEDNQRAIQTSDGGFAIAGDGDPWLIKTDSNGDITWQQAASTLGDYVAIYEIEEMADQGFIATGSMELTDIRKALVVRTDNTGAVSWSKAYGGEHDAAGIAITKTSDGGLAVAGVQHQPTGEGVYHGWLLKLDAAGDSLWSTVYGGTADAFFHGFQETADGGFILVGRQKQAGRDDTDIYIVKTNSLGVEEWSQTFGGTNDDEGISVVQTSDNEFTLAGMGDPYSTGNMDGWILHMAANGDSLWDRQVAELGVDACFDLVEISAGEYLVAGGTITDWETGQFEGWLVRLGTDTIPPAIPTGLVTIAGDGQVILSWTEYTGSGYVEYCVEMGTDPASFTAIDTTWNSTITITGLTNGTPYYFRIKAVDESGNESDYSSVVSATPQAGLFEADSLALVALYDSTGGLSWGTQWDLYAPVSSWDGVTITGGRVTKLNLYHLYGGGLTGALPAAIGDLTALTSLRLWHNELTYIPPEIGNLVNLKELALSKNKFTAVPTEISNLINLEDLYLSDNLLASLPAGIGGLSSLKSLSLGKNELTSIPAEISGLANLTSLDMSENEITELPASIGSMDSLKGLGLSGNKLAAIPAAIGGLVNLEGLTLSYNLLTSIPDEVGSLTNLVTLYLDGNQLASVPSTLGGLTSLVDLYLGDNRLTSLPTEMSGMTSLVNLGLGMNRLTSIPAGILSLTNLEVLYLNDNQLTGEIPTDIGNMTDLIILRLNGNELTGPIPDAIGELVSLRYFYLSHNQLSGAIPDTLGNLVNLEQLQLGYNRFTGTIPAALGRDTSLTYLVLSGNQLTGEVPAELGNLHNLSSLRLDYNELTGAVPAQLANLHNLSTLSMSYNQLEDLPDLSSMPALTDLRIDNNRFTFEDIEPNVNLSAAPGPLNWSYYSPQDSVGEETRITVGAGSPFTLEIAMGGSATQYQWIQNGVEIAGATDSTYSISSAAHEHGGTYYLKATNTIATGLELISRPQYVLAPNTPPVAAADSAFTIPSGAALGVDILAAAYDADGDSLFLSNVKSTKNGSAEICKFACGSPQINYIPKQGYTGMDTVWYTVNDIMFGSATSRLIITLTDYVGTPPIDISETFGGSENDRGYSVQEVADGYIIAGYTESSGAGDADAWLIKTDANGAAQWSKTFGGSYSDKSYSVQQTTDGGYILAGETESSGAGKADAWLIKTDASGVVTWEQTFGGSDFDNFIEVQQTADGGYIAAGQTYSDVQGVADGWLIKTDASGVAAWTKTFGGADTSMFFSVKQAADGGYIVVGYTESTGEGKKDIWLIKTDAAGETSWAETFGGSDDDIGYSVIQTSDGGYLVAGETEIRTYGYDAWIIKTDASGILEWQKTIEDWLDAAYSVRQTADNGYIIAGYGYIGWSYDNYVLVRMDALGEVLWNQFSLGAYGDDQAFTVDLTADGGCIVVGYTASFGVGGEDVWLIKIGEGSMAIDGYTRPIPDQFALHQNYPNPFNPSTTIRFDLPEAAEVTLLVYDLLGREMVRLVDDHREAGYHRVVWNGRDRRGREIPTGLYIARLVTPEYARSIKLLLLK
ncbi:MAG: T9SS type A sorting domain-containing protein [Fidelibacterota bacterium]|nr:MAG: T9SS type A sorting domain-containing protein [Candidatus Neomarinimicrobiota bacterium]